MFEKIKKALSAFIRKVLLVFSILIISVFLLCTIYISFSSIGNNKYELISYASVSGLLIILDIKCIKKLRNSTFKHKKLIIFLSILLGVSTVFSIALLPQTEKNEKIASTNETNSNSNNATNSDSDKQLSKKNNEKVNNKPDNQVKTQQKSPIKPEKKLSYKIVNEVANNIYAVIDKALVNSEDIKKIGKKLKKDFSTRDPIRVYIFDDETIAKEWNNNYEDNPEKEKHFIAIYWKGGTRHDLWIMPNGMNGEKEKVTYEQRKARYNVELKNVSVRIDNGAFIITNKSGQNLTNVEMIININSSSKNQYTFNTDNILNGNVYSVGLMNFANKNNELFNPFAMKVQSLTIYSDQGNLWVFTK